MKSQRYGRKKQGNVLGNYPYCLEYQSEGRVIESKPREVGAVEIRE